MQVHADVQIWKDKVPKDKVPGKLFPSGIKQAHDVYAADADVIEKLGWFPGNFLLKHKLAIIFDNFEENQDKEKGEFHRERLKKFLWFFRDALKNKETFLFFSQPVQFARFSRTGIHKGNPGVFSGGISQDAGQQPGIKQDTKTQS